MSHRHLGQLPTFGPTYAFAQAVDPYVQREAPGALYAPYGWGTMNIGMPANYAHHIDYVQEPLSQAPPTPTRLRRVLDSTAVYGALALPALFLLGGLRGARLLGASVAAGAAISAFHAGTGVQSLVNVQDPDVPQPAGLGFLPLVVL